MSEIINIVKEMLKKGENIDIHKAFGKEKKNCVYCQCHKDVPQELIDDGGVEATETAVTLYAVEGKVVRAYPVFICWEEVSRENFAKVPGSYNVWPKDNGATTLQVREGKCYMLPAMVQACVIGEQLPEWVKDAGFPVVRNGNTFELTRTDWGGDVRVGTIGAALWVRYGEHDVNVLTYAERSVDEYIVSVNNVDVCTLREIL